MRSRLASFFIFHTTLHRIRKGFAASGTGGKMRKHFPRGSSPMFALASSRAHPIGCFLFFNEARLWRMKNEAAFGYEAWLRHIRTCASLHGGKTAASCKPLACASCLRSKRFISFLLLFPRIYVIINPRKATFRQYLYIKGNKLSQVRDITSLRQLYFIYFQNNSRKNISFLSTLNSRPFR